MSATAKQIAAALGISEAAVSMALNNKPGVSTATRRLVWKTAEELGYDFTRIRERNAPFKEINGTISFILFRRHGAVVTDTPFFAQVSEGVGMACKEEGYHLNVSYLYEGDDVARLLKDIEAMGCKGVVLLGTEMRPEDFAPFTRLEMPLVLLDAYFDRLPLDYVLINNLQGAYAATSYLINKRKTQPGYLHSSYAIHNFNQRSEGFYRALREHGMPSSKSPVHYLTPSLEGAYGDMIELLESGEDMTGCYFADNDLIACGAMRALLEKGYRIPEDVALVGFDNMPTAAYISPALTTVHVPKQEMGQTAVRRLTRLIRFPDDVPLKIELSTSLIKRKSV